MLLTIATIGGLALLFAYGFGMLSGRKSGTLDSALPDADLTLSDDKSSFEQLLARGVVRQLTEWLNETEGKYSNQFLVRLDNTNKRIAVADRILTLSPDEKTRKLAISTKLNALTEREIVAFENDFLTESMTYELKQFALLQRQSSDLLLSRLATAAEAVAAISEFMQGESGTDRASLASAATEKMQGVILQGEDEPEIARVLFDWLRVIWNRCEKDESQKFLEIFVSGFAESTDPGIANLVVIARNASRSGLEQLVDFLEALPSQREALIEQFAEQVDEVLKQNGNNQFIVSEILDKADGLLALGRDSEAREILSSVVQLRNNSWTVSLNNQIELFDKRLNLLNSPLDISKMSDADGRPAKFKLGAAKHRLLFLASAENNRQRIKEFDRLLASVLPLVRKSMLEIAFVYVDDGQHGNLLHNVKQVTAEKRLYHVWLIKSVDYDDSLNQVIPYHELPETMVLNDQGKVVSLGSSPEIVAEVLSD